MARKNYSDEFKGDAVALYRKELARLRAEVGLLRSEKTRLATERDILRSAAKYFAGETNW